MPIVETLLTTIADKVFSYALDQTGLGERLRDVLGRNPTRRAFQRALDTATKQFEQKDPQWAESLFNHTFFEKEGAEILARFLLPGGHPDPSDLAERWATAVNLRQPDQRSTYVRELEPVAANFLSDLATALEAEEDLRGINDSRTFKQIAENTLVLRRQVEANRATPGTCRDYLNWMIAQHRYLDPRGIPQTQRQVQVKLDEVYISLRAQRDETPGAVDWRLLEQELKELEASLEAGQLPAEEAEDLREQLFARFEQRQLHESARGEVIELAQAVNRHDRLVILGDPGSGKTTLLRYLALKHALALQAHRPEADDQLGAARLPILIRIAEYAQDGLWKEKSLSDFLASYCMNHECPKAGLADLLEEELKNGHCLVLLDGLDEIVDADDRRGVVNHIDEFVRRHSSRPNRFVVTSRIAGYRSAPIGGGFEHYTVQDMDEQQIQRFLERWCPAVEEAQTPEQPPEVRAAAAQREIDGILKAVKESPGVRRLAANPLLLCALALIHRTGARLPEKRVELYKLAAEVLTRTWRAAQGVPESALVKDEYLTPLLSKLAYWLHETKPTGIATEQEVYQVLGKEWAAINDLAWDAEQPNPAVITEIRHFLEAVRIHTGLFVERAPQRYGFMHLTFEEYYPARALIALSRTRAKLIRQHLHDSRWQEPILLALGLVGLESPAEVTSLVETAILAEGEDARAFRFAPSAYEELLGRDYLFALRCLGDQIPVNIRLARRLVERLADEQLHRSGPARFSRYRQALNEMLTALKGGRAIGEFISLLVSALQDAHADVRSSAAESLGQLGQPSPAVIAALLTALRDKAAGVRSQAAQILGQLKQPSPEVVTALFTALRDRSVSVRHQAAASLARLGQTSPDMIAWLLDGLHNAKEWETHQSCADLLGQVSEPDEPTIQALWRGLLDSYSSVRAACAAALARLGKRFPSSRQVIEAKLVQAINDPTFDAPDRITRWSAHEYAFDGLWQLVENGQR